MPLARAFCAVLLASFVLAPGIAHANNTATTTATAKAAIVRPATLVKADDLLFGSIIPGNTAGTVIINENTCARSKTGGAILAGGLAHCAQFGGQATIGILMTTSLDNTVTLTGDAGGTMTASLVLRGGEGTTFFPGTGLKTFWVGGTLNVARYQTPGNYTGTFSMTVNYF